MRALAATAVSFALLAAPASASASTSVALEGWGAYTEVAIDAAATGGDVTLSADAAAITVAGTAGLSAGPGCVQSAADVVTCPRDVATDEVRFYGSAAADRVSVVDVPADVEVVAYGEGGDDVLHGGRGADALWGDAGADVLVGGPGDDRLRGGSGEDRVSGDEGADVLGQDAGADHLDAGPGDDLLISRESEGDIADHALACGDGDDEFDPGRTQIADARPADCERQAARIPVRPSLTGEARVGATLTVSVAVDGAPLPTSWITWYACPGAGSGLWACTPRVGGSAEYTVSEADAGLVLTAHVEASNASGSAVRQTPYTAPVPEDAQPPAGPPADVEEPGAPLPVPTPPPAAVPASPPAASPSPPSAAPPVPAAPWAPATPPGGRGLGLHFSGGSAADVLMGTSRADRLSGGGGHDRLAGDRGADALEGGDGDDRLDGGGGTDHLDGGADGDRLAGGAGPDRLDGGAGADRMYGGGGPDRLDGGDGDDLLGGGAGDDRLAGADGDDRLRGGSGRDVLAGGAGADRLDGGTGTDALDGGAGDDTLATADGVRDVVRCGAGRDTVVADASDTLVRCERVHVRR